MILYTNNPIKIRVSIRNVLFKICVVIVRIVTVHASFSKIGFNWIIRCDFIYKQMFSVSFDYKKSNILGIKSKLFHNEKQNILI